MSDYQEDIDYILDNFDFERVKKAMDALKWKYYDSADDTVSISELRKMARHVLKSLISHVEKDCHLIGCGGFKATVMHYEDCDKPVFELKFVIEEVSNEH